MTKIVTRPAINMFQRRRPCLTGGIWINNENSRGHSLGKGTEIGMNMACVGDTEGPAGAEVRVGEMMKDEAGVGGRSKTGSGALFTLP